MGTHLMSHTACDRCGDLWGNDDPGYREMSLFSKPLEPIQYFDLCGECVTALSDWLKQYNQNKEVEL